MVKLAASVTRAETVEMDPSALNVDYNEQKSYRFGKPAIESLAQKIKEQGQISPIVAIQKPGEEKPTVMFGFGRLEAIKGIKGMKVKVQVYDWKQKRQLFFRNLVESLHQGDMTHMDFAVTIRTMIYDMGMTQSEVKDWFDKSQSWVSQHVSMFNLSYKLQEMLHKGILPWTVAVNMAAADPKERELILEALEQARNPRISPSMSLRVRPHGNRRSMQEVLEFFNTLQNSNAAHGKVKRLSKSILEFIHGDMDQTAAIQSVSAIVTGKMATKVNWKRRSAA